VKLPARAQSLFGFSPIVEESNNENPFTEIKNLLMPTKTVHSEAMRVLSIALVTFASATSLWAQGQVVEGSEVLTEANRIEIEDISAFQLPPPSTFTPSNWLPPRTLSDSSGVEMIEVSRTRTLNDETVQPIFPPMPVSQVQLNQAGIQPAPEPSTFALLVVGLLIGAAIVRRSRIGQLNQIKPELSRTNRQAGDAVSGLR
jgi:hypothetical protein